MTLRQKGIQDEAVLNAMHTVPRELFVLPDDMGSAYLDTALPIESNQTISQPYIVARMLEAAKVTGPFNKVLEVGVGSGYLAAILSYLAQEVYGIERVKILYQIAQKRLQKLSRVNINLKLGDGYHVWPEKAPFDAIIVSATAPYIPTILIDQLKDGGRLVIPVQTQTHEELQLITKKEDAYKKVLLDIVRFVPLKMGVER